MLNRVEIWEGFSEKMPLEQSLRRQGSVLCGSLGEEHSTRKE